jgi:hypothetical protein
MSTRTEKLVEFLQGLAKHGDDVLSPQATRILQRFGRTDNIIEALGASPVLYNKIIRTANIDGLTNMAELRVLRETNPAEYQRFLQNLGELTPEQLARGVGVDLPVRAPDVTPPVRQVDTPAPVTPPPARTPDAPAPTSRAPETPEAPSAPRTSWREHVGSARRGYYDRLMDGAYGIVRGTGNFLAERLPAPLALGVRGTFNTSAFLVKNIVNIPNAIVAFAALHFATGGQSTKLATQAGLEAIHGTADLLKENWPEAAQALKDAAPWLTEQGIRIAGTPQDVAITAFDTAAERDFSHDPEQLHRAKFAARLAVGAFMEAVIFQVGWSDSIDGAKMIRIAMEANDENQRGNLTAMDYFTQRVAQEIGEDPEQVRDKLYLHRHILGRDSRLATLINPDSGLAANDLPQNGSTPVRPGNGDDIAGRIGPDVREAFRTAVGTPDIPAIRVGLTDIANRNFANPNASESDLSNMFNAARAAVTGGDLENAPVRQMGFFEFVGYALGISSFKNMGLTERFNTQAAMIDYVAEHSFLASIVGFVASSVPFFKGPSLDIPEMQRLALENIDEHVPELLAKLPTELASANDVPETYVFPVQNNNDFPAFKIG